jgi:excinuclease UvrABC nuclease subunit
VYDMLSIQQIIVAKQENTQRRCGVYFLVKDDVVLYVGKSVNVDARIAQHRLSKSFDSYTFIECSEADLDTVERGYIEELNPPLNKKMRQDLKVDYAPPLRTPMRIYQQIRIAAQKDRRSITSLVAVILEQWLEKHEGT